ncbi:NADase-type glycan-binding domain-containing protein [Nocardioides lianchengensis]|uniref:NAD glycohydrolase translocation F5/8 type C domain-containing protein n=1 Tax=Nocardioides lianchengensis TaxID=1045774 RepID=A0A1G6MSI5_9ACTN|nr:zinc ribbon domain-containing protein [Nocardioides lianchengensis]NYG10524.1 hypothetical protein [Nocardioides lianchengensis]SDC58411.1 hypothetical protein SAMN05421872_1037 [Nocardioides lianchengensis]
MTTCTRCGHRIEVGRFCTNCGAPVGPAGAGPTDTAERPAVPTAGPTSPPPPLPPAPTTARFPLFADEVGAAGPPPPPPPPPSEPPSGPPTTPPAGRPAHRRRTGWLVWVVTAAVLVVVALAGASLLLAGGGDDDDRADDPAGSSSTEPAEETTPADPGADPPTEETPAEEAPAGEPEDVAGAATAEVPATAPPGTDVDGARIRYDADKMLDGDPTTCWRMTGDGTGREIVLTLAEPTTVSALGLINGYAKTARDGRDRPLNWYAGNRRILAVEWELDDGTVVPQDLRETRDLQAVEIDPVETSRIVLRLVKVSSPGKGRAKRDNTAVSEVAVVGTPAG